jgi:hypothetical protein
MTGVQDSAALREPNPAADAEQPPMVVDANGDTVALFAVEYQFQGRRWRPHSIVTGDDTWDAYWSRREGMLVHSSGNGHYPGRSHWVSGYMKPRTFPGRLWTAPGVTLERYGGENKPSLHVDEACLRRMGIKRFAKLPGNPFEDVRNVEGHVDYCTICRDYFDDAPDGPCDHLRWSDYACQQIGSGADTECEAYVSESITVLCAHLGRERVQKLRLDVASARRWYQDDLHEFVRGVEHFEDHEEDKCRTAVSWFWTLNGSGSLPMRRAVRQTLRYIDAWLRQ